MIKDKVMLLFNKIKKQRTISILVMALVFIPSVFIQGQSQYDVIVNTAFSPSIRDAQKKINQRAVVTDTVDVVQTVTYDLEPLPFKPNFAPEPIIAPKVGKDRLQRLYRNYTKLGVGVGEFISPYLDFYMSSLRSTSNHRGLHLHHYSGWGGTWGKIKNYGPSNFSHSKISLFDERYHKNFSFKGKVDYNHDFVHCYGYRTDSLLKMYDLPSKSVLPKAKDIERMYHHLRAEFSAASLYKQEDNKLLQSYDLTYDFLFDNFKSHEHQLKAQTDLYKRINVRKLNYMVVGGNVGFQYFHNYWGNQALKNDNFLFNIKPLTEFEYKTFLFRAGIDLATKIEKGKGKFLAFPDLEARMNVVPNVLTFSVGVDGGYNRFTYLDLQKGNPYLSDSLGLGFNGDWRFYVSSKTNLTQSLTFGARASLIISDNLPLYICDTAQNFAVNDTTSIKLYNTYNSVSDVVTSLNAHVDLSYHYKNIFEFTIAFDYNYYKPKKEKYAWYKPMFIITFDAAYNLKDKVLFHLDFYIHTGTYRRGIAGIDNKEYSKLRSIVDFNLGVEYRWNKRFSLFLDVNNFASQQNFLFYNYPTQQINCLLGVKYLFGGEKVSRK